MKLDLMRAAHAGRVAGEAVDPAARLRRRFNEAHAGTEDRRNLTAEQVTAASVAAGQKSLELQTAATVARQAQEAKSRKKAGASAKPGPVGSAPQQSMIIRTVADKQKARYNLTKAPA